MVMLESKRRHHSSTISDSHAAMCSSNGTDGCIRKCGGLILAYLVTGFSGVCRAHSALIFPDMRRLRYVQN